MAASDIDITNTKFSHVELQALMAPCTAVRAVTPADGSGSPLPGVDLPDGPCKALLVGGAGDIKLKDWSGQIVTIPAQAGYNPIICRAILATGTTATNIVALY